MDAAIFLDKDGTLIHDVPYNVDPGRMTLSPGAVAGLRQLQQAGYRLVVVSNQSGVARGYFDETALEGVARRLCHLLEAHQVYLDGFYYCPHHPSGVGAAYRQSCDCRKPLPGMLLRAAAELNLDLGRSWLIGDILNDVEAGIRAGCRTVLLNNGNETEWRTSLLRVPDFVAANIDEAAAQILAAERLPVAPGKEG